MLVHKMELNSAHLDMEITYAILVSNIKMNTIIETMYKLVKYVLLIKAIY
jgi:hypothetical protein